MTVAGAGASGDGDRGNDECPCPELSSADTHPVLTAETKGNRATLQASALGACLQLSMGKGHCP